MQFIWLGDGQNNGIKNIYKLALGIIFDPQLYTKINQLVLMSVQKTQSSKKIFALVAGVMITAIAAGLVLFTGLI